MADAAKEGDASQSHANARILICGDVKGKLNQLSKRIQTIHKSSGNFDFVLCVGSFFPDSAPDIHACEIFDYISGNKAFSIPIYFIGDHGQVANEILSAHGESNSNSNSKPDGPGVEICHNIIWLRRHGLITIKGLKIAYMSGKFQDKGDNSLEAYGFSQTDVVDLVDECANCPMVDVLLTNDWPEGVLNGIDLSTFPESGKQTTLGCPQISVLAREIKPRYHFCGEENIFYVRQPYISSRDHASTTIGNPPSSTIRYANRFIALASVGNDKKQKFVHALSLLPSSEMSIVDLSSLPEIITPSPYEMNHTNNKRELTDSVPTWASEIMNEYDNHTSTEQSWRYSAPPSKKSKTTHGNGERICFELVTKGSCSRGDTCRFMHSKDGKPLPRHLCIEFFKSGSCERGDSCKFNHSLDEEARSERFVDGKRGLETSLEEPIPKGLCFDFFRKGRCSKEDCRFSHSKEDFESNKRNSTASSSTPQACWFCLSSPEVETHLIISVSEHCYCAMAKGAMSEDHTLILPIEHFPNLISLPSEVLLDLQKYKMALAKLYAESDCVPVFFERFVHLRTALHAHLQSFPVPNRDLNELKNAFVNSSNSLNVAHKMIKSNSDIIKSVDDIKRIVRGGNYFTVEFFGDEILVISIESSNKTFPLQFGRQVISEFLGDPQKVDWKKCVLDRDGEEKITNDFKERFKPFDLM